MSEKGQARKSMFSVQNVEELRRLYESDTPVLAYDFKRRMVEGWTPEHSHHRGQLVALTQGLLIVETENERWMFPSQRAHGLHQIVSTRRVLSGALLARWWTCLRRCVADCPRRPACSTHRSYFSP